MISQEISWWDISLVQVIQVIQLIQVIQVGLVHLWSDFRVIWWKTSVFKAFLTNNSRGEGEISPILLLFFLYRCFVKRGRGTTFSLICKVEFDAAPNKTANLFDTFSFTYGGITKDRNPQRLFFVQDFLSAPHKLLIPTCIDFERRKDQKSDNSPYCHGSHGRHRENIK